VSNYRVESRLAVLPSQAVISVVDGILRGG